jgi:hypothetical protein
MTFVKFRCQVCRFFYVVEEYDVKEHQKLHKKFHDEFINGIKAIPLNSDEVISEVDGFKIVLVSPNSTPSQRMRAERIAFRCKLDTRFNFAPYHAKDREGVDSPLVFIGIIENRAIGFLVFRKTEKTLKVKWAKEHYNLENKVEVPLLPDKRWGVSMVWVLESKRRVGYATKLIETASSYVGISISDIAWFKPFTEFGHPLAKKLSPNEVILTI